MPYNAPNFIISLNFSIWEINTRIQLLVTLLIVIVFPTIASIFTKFKRQFLSTICKFFINSLYRRIITPTSYPVLGFETEYIKIVIPFT